MSRHIFNVDTVGRFLRSCWSMWGSFGGSPAKDRIQELEHLNDELDEKIFEASMEWKKRALRAEDTNVQVARLVTQLARVVSPKTSMVETNTTATLRALISYLDSTERGQLAARARDWGRCKQEAIDARSLVRGMYMRVLAGEDLTPGQITYIERYLRQSAGHLYDPEPVNATDTLHKLGGAQWSIEAARVGRIGSKTTNLPEQP